MLAVENKVDFNFKTYDPTKNLITRVINNAGMEIRRGGDMLSAMAAAQAEREAVKKRREEKEAKEGK